MADQAASDLTPPREHGPLPMRAIVIRAGAVALVLGSILTLTNQASALFGPDPIALLPLVLVYLTPFTVVAISQLLGIHQALREREDAPAPDASFWATVAGHSIPLRAVLTGLIAGSANTTIMLLSQFPAADLPLPLIAQALRPADPVRRPVASPRLPPRASGSRGRLIRPSRPATVFGCTGPRRHA